MKTSCIGQYNPGSSCSFTYAGGSGSYRSEWGGSFSSPTISV
ncbi:hypothetical protein ABZ671_22435 [Micromonospora sp. NPDC006766]